MITLAAVAILAASEMVGAEMLVLFLPFAVAIGAGLGASSRYPKSLGALGGAVSGIIGLVIPSAVWSYMPLESGMVNQYLTPPSFAMLTCAIMGGVAGATMGAFLGAHVAQRRQQKLGIARDWPIIAMLVVLSTWVLFVVSISNDPWSYFNDTPEDYIPFEGRIYMSLVYGTPVAIAISVPVVLVASAIYAVWHRTFSTPND